MTWTTPRTWVTSEVVTATELNAHVRDNTAALADRVQSVRKGTNQAQTSNTALANDADLSFTVVAGQDYEFDSSLIFNAPLSGIDAKVGFAFPAGTLSFMGVTLDPAVGSGTIGSGAWGAFSSATSGTSALGVGVASSDTGARVSGSFHCTASGTVTLMWAQNTTSGSALTLKAGSTLRATRVSV